MNKQPVYYMQTDPRWSGKDYSAKGETTTIGKAGCGPTSAAMLIETMTGKTFTPVDAVSWSLKNGYKAANQGTYYSYFKPQFAAHGIECVQLNLSTLYGNSTSSMHNEMLNLLKNGYYIIACMGPGTWTTSGHYVVVWWEDGKIRINDPASTSVTRTSGNLATFKKEVKYYWAINAREFNKEEEVVTQADFNKMMEVYLAEIKNEPLPIWAETELKEAIAMGITDGTQPMALIPRYQAAIMSKRAKK